MRTGKLFSLLLLAAALPAWGDIITMSLTPPELSGLAGATLTFQGVLSNPGTETIFLNSVESNFAVSGFDIDTLVFFVEAPISLDPSESTGLITLFTVTISSPYASAGGPFMGTFDILGGLDDGAQEFLGSVDFFVATPEPGSFALLAGGAALGMMLLRARRRGSKPTRPATECCRE
jgi:hypothetical protein